MIIRIKDGKILSVKIGDDCPSSSGGDILLPNDWGTDDIDREFFEKISKFRIFEENQINNDDINNSFSLKKVIGYD